MTRTRKLVASIVAIFALCALLFCGCATMQDNTTEGARSEITATVAEIEVPLMYDVCDLDDNIISDKHEEYNITIKYCIADNTILLLKCDYQYIPSDMRSWIYKAHPEKLKLIEYFQLMHYEINANLSWHIVFE